MTNFCQQVLKSEVLLRGILLYHACLYLVVKVQQYFVTSSCMFLDEENRACIFPGTGPWSSRTPWKNWEAATGQKTVERLFVQSSECDEKNRNLRQSALFHYPT